MEQIQDPTQEVIDGTVAHILAGKERIREKLGIDEKIPPATTPVLQFAKPTKHREVLCLPD